MSGHYYGYKRDDDLNLWVKLDDDSIRTSRDDVSQYAFQGASTAHMLHYVNVDKKKDLFKIESIPPAVLIQINNELSKKESSGVDSVSPLPSKVTILSSIPNEPLLKVPEVPKPSSPPKTNVEKAKTEESMGQGKLGVKGLTAKFGGAGDCQTSLDSTKSHSKCSQTTTQGS